MCSFRIINPIHALYMAWTYINQTAINDSDKACERYIITHLSIFVNGQLVDTLLSSTILYTEGFARQQQQLLSVKIGCFRVWRNWRDVTAWNSPLPKKKKRRNMQNKNFAITWKFMIFNSIYLFRETLSEHFCNKDPLVKGRENYFPG